MSINNFTMNAVNRQNLITQIERLDCVSTLYTVNVIPKKSKRSLAQNARYWGFLTEFGKYLGYDKAEMHDLMRSLFLFEMVILPDGRESKKLLSTPKENTAQMAEYMDAIERQAAQWGFVWEWEAA